MVLLEGTEEYWLNNLVLLALFAHLSMSAWAAVALTWVYSTCNAEINLSIHLNLELPLCLSLAVSLLFCLSVSVFACLSLFLSVGIDITVGLCVSPSQLSLPTSRHLAWLSGHSNPKMSSLWRRHAGQSSAAGRMSSLVLMVSDIQDGHCRRESVTKLSLPHRHHGRRHWWTLAESSAKRTFNCWSDTFHTGSLISPRS